MQTLSTSSAHHALLVLRVHQQRQLVGCTNFCGELQNAEKIKAFTFPALFSALCIICASLKGQDVLGCARSFCIMRFVGHPQGTHLALIILHVLHHLRQLEGRNP